MALSSCPGIAPSRYHEDDPKVGEALEPSSPEQSKIIPAPTPARIALRHEIFLTRLNAAIAWEVDSA